MWTEEEDKILIEKIMSGIEKWAEIATFLNNRTSNSCRERWVNHLSPKINKEPWTTEEDEILLANQKILGNKWASISKLLNGRPPLSVRNRWKIIGKRLPSSIPVPPVTISPSFLPKENPLCGDFPVCSDLEYSDLDLELNYFPSDDDESEYLKGLGLNLKEKSDSIF